MSKVADWLDDQARAILDRAVERGEIPVDTKIDVALDGPLYHRLWHGRAPLNDRSSETSWTWRCTASSLK